MLFSGLDNILMHYNTNDIFVSRIHADNKFRSIINQLEDEWDIVENFFLSGEHVPNIERLNRVLQERFRVALYILRFHLIPRVMIVRLALIITRTENFRV